MPLERRFLFTDMCRERERGGVRISIEWKLRPGIHGRQGVVVDRGGMLDPHGTALDPGKPGEP